MDVEDKSVTTENAENERSVLGVERNPQDGPADTSRDRAARIGVCPARDLALFASLFARQWSTMGAEHETVQIIENTGSASHMVDNFETTKVELERANFGALEMVFRRGHDWTYPQIIFESVLDSSSFNL